MKLKEIPVDKIKPNPLQPREHFDRDKLKELANSIKEIGLINPIQVRKKGKQFEIVAGERRWKAHQIAKKKKILALEKEYKDDGQVAIESLIENVHRENLSSYEQAKFLKRIWELKGKPINRQGNPDIKLISVQVGLGEDAIAEAFDLLGMPTQVKQAVQKGKLAMRSASMISQLPEEEQIEIAEESMRRETGIGRTEIQKEVEERKIKKEYGIESLELERTEQDIVNDILSDLSNFKEHFSEMKKKGFDMFNKSSLQRISTSIVVSFTYLLDLIKFGIKPDKRFLDLIKKVKDGKKIS